MPSGDDEVPGGGVDDFFGALGGVWRLTAAQRDRLAPAVGAALSAGWMPAGLAEVTGANTGGVRNRHAVLAARLSPAEPPASVPQRPPWCGQCDQRTRRREDADGADAGRCPVCHPLAGPAGRAGGGRRDAGWPGRTGARLASDGHDAVSAGAGGWTRAGLGEG